MVEFRQKEDIEITLGRMYQKYPPQIFTVGELLPIGIGIQTEVKKKTILSRIKAKIVNWFLFPWVRVESIIVER